MKSFCVSSDSSESCYHLVLSTDAKDVKDAFTSLKDTAAELNGGSDTLKHQVIFYIAFTSWFVLQSSPLAELLFLMKPYSSLQIAFSLLFSLIIAFVSDALGAVSDKPSILSHDASFRHEFHEMVSWIVLDDMMCFPQVLLIFCLIWELMTILHLLGNSCRKWSYCWGICWCSKTCMGGTYDANTWWNCINGGNFKCFIKWFREHLLLPGGHFL